MDDEDRFSAVQRAPPPDSKPPLGSSAASPIPISANGSRGAWALPGSGAAAVSGRWDLHRAKFLFQDRVLIVESYSHPAMPLFRREQPVTKHYHSEGFC